MDLQMLLGLVIALISTFTALLTVTLRDLVYSSILLAILGSLTAAIIALLGYYIVAAFIIIVYVGAAVMFIILSVSMLGGGGVEVRNNIVGVIVALAVLLVLPLALVTLGVQSFAFPVDVNVRDVSDSLSVDYLVVLALLLVSLAATIIEGIAIARRG